MRSSIIRMTGESLVLATEAKKVEKHVKISADEFASDVQGSVCGLRVDKRIRGEKAL